ncbi:hypothetical protein C1Y35_24660 [Pseudomonas sp. GW456-L14]|nr:hypothetical protein C1Y35_24660 [Pseudomonas sp. GW456-L14]PMY58585.1 hypothetical protein C1Y34_05595 [Pseudomonas sp. GW456-L12]
MKLEDVYKSRGEIQAQFFAACDRSASRSQHCWHCAYLSICDSIARLTSRASYRHGTVNLP